MLKFSDNASNSSKIYNLVEFKGHGVIPSLSGFWLKSCNIILLISLISANVSSNLILNSSIFFIEVFVNILYYFNIKKKFIYLFY